MQKFTTIYILITISFILTLLSLIYMVFLQNKDSQDQQFNCGLIEPFEFENQIKGFKVWEENCAGCHSLTQEVIVGPGLFKTTVDNSKKYIYSLVETGRIVNKNKHYKNLVLKFGSLGYHLDKYSIRLNRKNVDSIIYLIDSTTKIQLDHLK